MGSTAGPDFVDEFEGSGAGMNDSDCLNAYCVGEDDYELMMEDHIFPTTSEWFLVSAHIIVFIVGLVGNLLVCVAVYRNSSMRTVTNYFIVNLAVADFMVILFCLPPTVVWDVTETWFLGELLCKVVLYFQTVSVSVSVLTLTVISVERWYAICFPLKFKATTSRAKRAIVGIWIISLVFDIPELIVLETSPREGMKVSTIFFTQCAPSWGWSYDITYSFVRIALLYLLPLVFMSFAYYQIVRVLWSSANIPGARRSSGDTPPSSNRSQLLVPMNRGLSNSQGHAVDFQMKSRRKAAKMLVAVVTMFAVCYLPVHVYSILNLLVNIQQDEVIGAAVLVSHWLPYANSAMNPIIYNFMSAKFRKAFLRNFNCCGLRRRRPRIRRQTRFRSVSRGPSSSLPMHTIRTEITIAQRI